MTYTADEIQKECERLVRVDTLVVSWSVRCGINKAAVVNGVHLYPFN